MGEMMGLSDVIWRILCSLGLAISIYALGGCSSSDEIMQVRQDIVAAGFNDAGVHVRHIQGAKTSEDRVEVVLRGNPMDREAAWETTAKLVWDTLPVNFDTLLVEYQGEVKVTTYADLEGQFGARPDGLVEQSMVGMLAERVGRAVVAVGAIGAIALVSILVLIRRHRRRHRAEKDGTHRDG
jgi:hypothetical protein